MSDGDPVALAREWGRRRDASEYVERLIELWTIAEAAWPEETSEAAFVATLDPYVGTITIAILRGDVVLPVEP